MDTSPFETGYTQHVPQHQVGGMYGSVPGFDKFHHGVYPEAGSDSATYYPNYVQTGVGAPQEFCPREPPTYAESTAPATSSAMLHPSFIHNGSMDYYKASGMGGGVVATDPCGAGSILRSMDMVSDYHGAGRNPAMMTDNFLMKQEAVSGVGPDHLLSYSTTSYTDEELQRLHQHQQQHSSTLPHLQQVHQHMQPSKAQLQMQTDVPADSCKQEPDSLTKFKAHDESSSRNSVNIGSLQQQQQVQTEHDNLPASAAPDGSGHHLQSPGSDKTSGEGPEETAGSEEQNVHANREASKSPHDSDAGIEADKSSNEVKPTLSYIALIAKSILESPQRRLNLGSIYGWIEKNFPYYHNRGQGWRNSVRHNLSLNDCFIKAGRCEDGKGNYWAIHPANMQDFLRGDFRQRRRSRRRGRKKDCELSLYHHHQFGNAYLGASGVAAAAAAAASGPLAVGAQMPFAPSAASLSNIYSPYTEAERRAYRLDEALLRQSMNNPFFKWYHQPATSPSPVNNTVYSGVANVTASSSQWPQSYAETNGQGVYSLNSSFSR